MKSIKQVSEQVEQDLQEYLESSYHLHHPRLLKERRELMNQGETSTEPWVEATPSYVPGKKIRDLGLPDPVADILKDLEADGLDIFDPPYKHQADALQAFFNDDKDLIVSTGTGSGKTEIFLYSILGQLAREAQRGNSTDHRGIRTLVLYPMNALVADQLARMRLLFGDRDGSNTIEEYMGRRVQFGMYTSRTPYHGEYDTDKNDQRLKPIIDRYLDLKSNKPDLYNRLKEKGRIPAKDLEGFRSFGNAKDTHFRTQRGDTELFTRQEMHSPNKYGGIPDLLITNYSMLEYMLLRPIEQPFFEETKEWLEADEENELNIVLDEAHLYRGAQGAEVGLLLSRLLQKLGISRERVRFILTSATMGENIDEAAPEFAAQLTTGNPEEFAVIKGEQESYDGGEPSDKRTAEILSRISYDLTESKVRNLAAERGWEAYTGSSGEELRKYLATQLKEDSLFALAHDYLEEEPLPLSDLAPELFPEIETELAEEATGNLLYLCTEAKRREGQALLPTRLHMFLKGLPKQYACINPDCSGRRATDGGDLLGRFYTSPQSTCDTCGSRVFELLSHRTCGAAYLKAYQRTGEESGRTFLWSDAGTSDDLDEVHLLVEEPRSDIGSSNQNGRSLADTTPSRKLSLKSGHLLEERFVDQSATEEYIDVWIPTEERPSEDAPWSWSQCPVCGIQEKWYNGTTKIQDLETKGEEPFANIVRSMFEIQPEDDEKDDLPNKGKKVLCFSDGRQKAARLARDLQSNVELDSFREVIADIVHRSGDDLTMDQFFAEFAVYCKEHTVVFFDDSDERITQTGVQYPGSRTKFQEILDNLEKIVERYPHIQSIQDIPMDAAARQEISGRPRQFDTMLLRTLGHEYFSISASLIGYLRPTEQVFERLQAAVPDVDEELLESVLIEIIDHACQERAFDESISPFQRNNSLSHGFGSYTDENSGLEYDEIIPDYLREIVGGKISDEQWQQLKNSFLQEPMLFEPTGHMKYMVNPDGTRIELRIDQDWYRCMGCYRFTPASLAGACPHEDCNGELEAVDDSDIHLQARKNHLRTPARRVVTEGRDPFTLRSEEHSAQLTAKDSSEALSRSEVYELLFQDILVGDKSEQPIDVLSCTTTMEVGIDIGSLTGVAMRTVPPGPENYEQRAGRAGRRGAGLSTILTFADNSPHESRYFNEPADMITSEGSEPIIYAGNEKIAERHVNASLLARFFGSTTIEPGAGVFESLGTGTEFFGQSGKHSFEAFREWVETEIQTPNSSEAAAIGNLLPDELGANRSGDWRSEFVTDASHQLIEELTHLKNRTDWTPTSEDDGGTEQDEDLLSVLLDDALLPTFSFPIDVCDFVVRGADANSDQPKTKYEMSRDLKQALSTYVPGREIVVDKKTYESYGVFFKFPGDQNDRATGVEWDELNWLNWCDRCETVYDNQDENMAEQDHSCSVCGEDELKSVQMFSPPAFAPEVDQYGRPEEGSSYNEERVYATRPKYPLTPTSEGSDGSDEMEQTKPVGPSTVGRLNDEQLLVANMGPDDEGFDVCTKCGAVGTGGSLDGSHNRPYPKDVRRMNLEEYTPQCDGSTVNTSFTHVFPSDLTVFRIPLTGPMQFTPEEDWFESAAQSLAEALVMGAGEALGIEDDELEGGFRTRSAAHIDDLDAHGVLELFLFDTTPGGAGFSSKVWEEFGNVLDEARTTLADCECESACHDCLRRYQNRHMHNLLNRHQGLALLDYAENGTIPTLTETKISALITRLEQSLVLQDSDIELQQQSDIDKFQVRMDGATLNFGVRSCLRDRRLEGTGLDQDFSDHELTHRLPEVAVSIIAELES